MRNSAPFDADAWRITQPSIADVKQGDILHVTRGGFDYDLRVTDVIPAAEAAEGTVTICTVPA